MYYRNKITIFKWKEENKMYKKLLKEIKESARHVERFDKNGKINV